MTDYRMKAELPKLFKGLLKPPKALLTGVQRINLEKLPEIMFEYHPVEKQVWWIDKRFVPAKAEKVADGVADQNQARISILLWSRGFLEGREFKNR